MVAAAGAAADVGRVHLDLKVVKTMKGKKLTAVVDDCQVLVTVLLVWQH